jgi:hypothetical protein
MRRAIEVGRRQFEAMVGGKRVDLYLAQRAVQIPECKVSAVLSLSSGRRGYYMPQATQFDAVDVEALAWVPVAVNERPVFHPITPIICGHYQMLREQFLGIDNKFLDYSCVFASARGGGSSKLGLMYVLTSWFERLAGKRS